MSWSGWLLHRHIYVKIIQITLCCILLYVIYTSKNKFKKFHKVNPPSLFSLKFSWLLLLLYFAIVKNLESLWWLRRCTAQISFQENLWWKGKWLLLSFCPWPLLAFDGNTVEILSQAIMAHYGWFLLLGIFVLGTPISLLETFSELHCSLRLFLPNSFHSPLLSQGQSCMVVHLLLCSLLFITHKHFPNTSLAHLILFWHQQDWKLRAYSLFS